MGVLATSEPSHYKLKPNTQKPHNRNRYLFTMPQEILSITLHYGSTGTFSGEILKSRLVGQHFAPEPSDQVADMAIQTFAAPEDYPDLKHVVVRGDRVVLVIERDTPGIDLIFQEFWNVLEKAGITPEDITILQPATWEQKTFIDPRNLLETDLKERICIKQHDPTVEGSCSYLANTSNGDRIYLANEVVDADVVITIGPAQFDPMLGYRGGASSLYPGMSDTDAIRSTIGQGHDELGPDDSRPLRQLVDEVGYVLGLQFTVTVLPGQSGGVHQVVAGNADAVMRKVHAQLGELWRFNAPERAEMVVVSVSEDAGGHGWAQIATAIESARRLVEREGRIVVLSELKSPLSPGLQILKNSRTPSDAIKPISRAAPPDLASAIQIARAADWANIYLLSQLPDDVVEDLFMVPLSTNEEVRKLLQSDDTTIIIEDGQFTYTSCQAK